jgi:hypothetical protein
MTEFIAMIYEWFGYRTDLGEHLRGYDLTCSGLFLGPDLYLQIFSYMVLTNILLYILMYVIIDRFTSRFSSKFSWWITALIGVSISYGIAFSLPNTVQACEQLNFNSGDLFLFGLANAWWSLVTFALLTSFPIPRNFSINTRLTTFWKP